MNCRSFWIALIALLMLVQGGMGVDLEALRRRFPDADRNRDGVLTEDEARQYREERRRRKRGARAEWKAMQSGVMSETNAFTATSIGEERLFDPAQVVDVSKRKVRAFILLGQSNMVGHGQRDKFAAKYLEQEKNPNVLRLYPSGWGPLQVMPEHNGPEISFAYDMAAALPGETIGIIKVAVGGTGIRAFLPEWSAALAGRDARKGPIYRQQILPRIELARKLCPGIVFSGVLWKQGGADMHTKDQSAGYLNYLKTIIAALRKDTGVPTLPLFVGTYMTAEELGRYTGKEEAFIEHAGGREAAYPVLKAQVEAGKQIPHTHVVVHGDLPVKDDGIHFNTEGQTLLGQVFARKVWEQTQRKSGGKAAGKAK